MVRPAATVVAGKAGRAQIYLKTMTNNGLDKSRTPFLAKWGEWRGNGWKTYCLGKAKKIAGGDRGFFPLLSNRISPHYEFMLESQRPCIVPRPRCSYFVLHSIVWQGLAPNTIPWSVRKQATHLTHLSVELPNCSLEHIMFSIGTFRLCRAFYLGNRVTGKKCWQGPLQMSLLLGHVLFGWKA